MGFASHQTAALVKLAETYAAHECRSLDAVSGLVKGKGGFFNGLKQGRDCTTASAEQVLDWFDLYWPVDLVWPTEVLRRGRPGKPLLPAGMPAGMPQADAECSATIWMRCARRSG